jgi:D-alanyl-D-alanine endopeptidase (penicillin-binding protein 7)
MVSIKQLFRPALQAWRRTAALPFAAVVAAGLTACASAPQPATVQTNDATAAVVTFQSCAKPEWPQSDFAAGHAGTVTLSFLVNTEGKAVDSKVLKSSGYQGLDEAARMGISKCSFKPATQHGKPMEAWMKMQYVWTHD